MSTYQVLARKYRPQQFAEVVGQGHIVRTLENAISQKRIAHAYLFVGPRGTGKTTMARIFAKALNCASSKEPTATPCDQCSNCAEIAAGNSMDVLEIDGASNNGVEQVRELREIVRYMPSKARFKIIYIDEVHMLSTAAFNALLKTLEEPPPHVKFLFATTDPQKMPLTILSRCQRFDLRRIPNDLIVQQLRKIAGQEKIDISADALLAIARGAVGGLRDAESALDQIIAFCGNKVEEGDILSIFGLAAREQIDRLSRGILAGDRAEVIRLVSSLSDDGKDLSRLLAELIAHFRNILVLQAGAEPAELVAEEIAEVRRQAGLLHRARTLRILEILTEADEQMRFALSRRILLEVALLRSIETRHEVLIEEVLKRLRSVAAESAAKEPDGPDSSGSPSATSSADFHDPPADAGNTPVLGEARERTESSPPNPSLETLWNQLLENVGKFDSMIKGALMKGRLLSMTEDTVMIGIDPEFEDEKGMIAGAKGTARIQGALRELVHKTMKIKVVCADDPSIPAGDEPSSSAPPSNATASDKDVAGRRFEDDPLIRKALEIFKGQIVEIRR